MANINLDGGINYTFARSQENTIILDSDNHCHASKSFANTVVISGSNLPFGNTYLTVGHDTAFGGSGDRPLVVLSHNNSETAANTNTYHDFQLALHNEANVLNSFSGIVFKNGSVTTNSDNYGAAIKAISTDAGLVDQETALTFWTNDDADDDCKERMRINEDGNVDIGANSSDDSVNFRIKSTAAETKIYSHSDGKTYFQTQGDIFIKTDGIDSISDSDIFIESSNNRVGIQTESPGQNLSVNGSIGYTSLVNISDERTKENIVPITGSLDKVLSLTGRKFNWKNEVVQTDAANLSGSLYGFIAQEVEEVLPELVNTRPSGSIIYSGSLNIENSKSISVQEIIPLLVESIKTLESRIRTLENN
jgi:hypothetical protein|tara:strand:+ start:105 stop:1196 length:1092 start_codon:yes stop_codon:yes gene_type:complete